MHLLTCAPPDARRSEIAIGEGAAEQALRHQRRGAFVLADAAVLEAHPPLRAAGAVHLTVQGGEAIKTFAALERVLRAMARLDLDRGATVIGLGGGTVGDLAGLAAALYKRGVELELVPTTLLAMLDGSIGGKTAINLPEGKNLVGQVWPASRVFIDSSLLASLPDEELSSGLGEALKVAIGLDAELFALLEEQAERVLDRDRRTLEQVIVRAVRAKVRIVEQDVRESGPRRLLNLGHTLAHALEARAAPRLSHGRAVARGLHFALRVAERRGAIATADAERCRSLLGRYGFAPFALPAAAELMPYLARDKKVDAGRLHFVVPTGIGSCRTLPLAVAEVAEALG